MAAGSGVTTRRPRRINKTGAGPKDLGNLGVFADTITPRYQLDRFSSISAFGNPSLRKFAVMPTRPLRRASRGTAHRARAMSGAIDVAVPTAPSPAGPGEVSHRRDAGTRGDAVGRETECSHVSAFFASREGRARSRLWRGAAWSARRPPARPPWRAWTARSRCALRAAARAHAAGTGGRTEGENLEPNANRKSACRGVFVDVRVAELFCAPCDARVYNRDFDRAVLGARGVLRGGENGALVKPTAADAATTAPTNARARKSRGEAVARRASRVRGERLLGRKGRRRVPSSSFARFGAQIYARRGARARGRAGRPARRARRRQPREHVLHERGAARDAAVAHGGRFFLPARRARARAVRVRACGAPGATSCLACELDGFASALASGDSAPVVPAAFLRAWWHRAPEHLRGQGQHDAHEFFLGLVGAAHADLARGAARGPATDAAPATDATHAQSGNSRETLETLETLGAAREGRARRARRLAVSVPDAPRVRGDAPLGRHVRRVRPRQHGDGPDRGPVAGRAGLRTSGRRRRRPSRGLGKDPRVTLEACLRRFARPERLCGAGDAGSGGGAFECARCGDRAAAKTKQMSLSRAPPRW